MAANITPNGLGNKSDATIKQSTTGKRPDGSAMMPPMGFAYYAGLREPDIDTIVAYLRSLPAK